MIYHCYDETGQYLGQIEHKSAALHMMKIPPNTSWAYRHCWLAVHGMVVISCDPEDVPPRARLHALVNT
jgi:hypothetical protein